MLLTTWRRRLSRTAPARAARVLRHAWGRFAREHGTTHAAALTYYTLLSLFPLLIFLVSVFGLVVRDPATQTRVATAVVRQLPAGPKLRADLVTAVSGSSDDPDTRAGPLGIVALLGTLWSGSLAFGALRRALNRAFDVPQARSFIEGRVVDVASMAGVGALGLLSAGLTAGLRAFQALANRVLPDALATPTWAATWALLPLLVTWGALLLMYRLIPNHTLGWRALRWVALLAALAIELAKAGIGLYLTTIGGYQRVYGALGGVIAFLFFVFIVANIVIFAAGLAAEWAADESAHAAPQPP